ncbi:hypothetical protein ACFL6S_34450 [Candidatus Poribacteria bacterium]
MMYSTPGIALDPPVELRNPPALNVKTEQVEGILDKLGQYWQRFTPHFQDREQREWGVKYISGRFMEGKKYFTNAIAHRVGEKNEAWERRTNCRAADCGGTNVPCKTS